MEHPKHFNAFAGVLAVGGIFWGLLASCAMFRSVASLVFIPGYIITLGYIVRCFYTPRLVWRRVIWGTSVILQGAWMLAFICVLGYEGLRNGGVTMDDILIPVVAWAWWIFALCVSIYGFRFDTRNIVDIPKNSN